MVAETKTISGNRFDKVQGQVYTEINGKKCQVKNQFNLSEIHMEIERFNNMEVING